MQFEAVQRTVSAACLPEDTIMGFRAGPRSTVPLHFINYETDYRSEGRAELVCHVRGEADDLAVAGEVLTNSGIRNLQLLAVAANAAVLSPHIEIVYEGRPGGRFRALRTLGDEPQTSRRTIDVERTAGLIQALDQHPRETRLLRAAANYGEALRRTQPASSVHAILHLWMAVENLTVVIRDRLFREHNVNRLAELGAALGVEPRGDGTLLDDRDVNGFVRRREVFGGDDATHRALKAASDGIEHGYKSFGEARELVEEIFDAAAAAIRRCILVESGLATSDIDALTTGIYARPLPLWRPRIVAEGQFGKGVGFDFARPAHVRVEGAVRTENIDPDQHATTAAVDIQVQAFDGLEVAVDRVGLGVPGEARLAPSEE